MAAKVNGIETIAGPRRTSTQTGAPGQSPRTSRREQPLLPDRLDNEPPPPRQSAMEIAPPAGQRIPVLGPMPARRAATGLAPLPPSIAGEPLYRAIHEAVARVADNSSVPPHLLLTTGNRIAGFYETGPEIFPGMAEWVQTAEREILFQTFVWSPDTDPTTTLIDALVELHDRRKQTHPRGPPIQVYALIAQNRIAGLFGKDLESQLRERLAERAFDPNVVRVNLRMYEFTLQGALHAKTFVVDRRVGMVTGANAQSQFNTDGSWYDQAAAVEGPAAEALAHDFFDAYGSPTPALPAAQPSADGVPVLVIGRRASGRPLHDNDDNTQNQAISAGFGAARESVRFINPNLNDNLVMASLKRALDNGARLEIILSYRFNEKFNVLPFAGGMTNQDAIIELRRYAASIGAMDRLDARWYAKEDDDPSDGGELIVGNIESASHAKAGAIDGKVVFGGSTNFDAQSWDHSRETSLMVLDAATAQQWTRDVFTPLFERAIAVTEAPLESSWWSKLKAGVSRALRFGRPF